MNTQTASVTGRDGLHGVIEDPASLNEPHTLTARLRLDDGSEVWVPVSMISREPGGDYRVPFGRNDLRAAGRNQDGTSRYSLDHLPSPRSAPADGAKPSASPTKPPVQTADAPFVVPVVEEQVDVRKRVVESGRVRVHKSVSEHQEVVQAPVIHEDVEITRVSVNRIVDGPVAVREEGDITIVPLMEEIAVVEKRLLLREELHIRKRKTEEFHPEPVTLRREEAQIERMGETKP